MSSAPGRIYTIGHSTRSLAELVELLTGHSIATLADVRRFPGSRRHPHFSAENLASELPPLGIHYMHLPSLGGRRKTSPDSPNTAWRNEQFRGYADHMGSTEFLAAVHELFELAEPVVIMCAEAVPWRCHRFMLSDELIHRGIEVVHILGPGSTKTHVMNPAARVRDGHLIYPAQEQVSLF